MTKEQFYKITEYIREKISGTEFEGKVFVVGGAVRDLVMGNEIKDIDLVINIDRGGIKLAEFFESQGLVDGHIIVYERFGTAMFRLLEFDGEEIECVHTRREYYPDKFSRDPMQEFGSIEEDCMRRDFTINALYYDITYDEIKDMTGHGLEDIERQIIRTTSNEPDLIFDEDPLRILRAIRFASRFNWGIDEGTIDSMVRNKGRLLIITKERIVAELTKMLACKHRLYAIDLMVESGIIEYILPGVFTEENKIQIIEALGRLESDSIETILALIFFMSNKTTDDIVGTMQSLRFPNHTMIKTCKTVEVAKKASTELPEIRKVIKNASDKTCVVGGALVAEAVSCEPGKLLGLFEQELYRIGEKPVLKVGGDDVMELFGVKGKEVKEVLKIAWDIFFEDPEISREELICHIREKF